MSGQPDMEQPEFRDAGTAIAHRSRFLQVAPLACLTEKIHLAGLLRPFGAASSTAFARTRWRSGLFWTVTGSTPSPGSGIWAEADWFSVPSGFEAHPPGPVSVYRPRVSCSNGSGLNPIGSPSPKLAAFTKHTPKGGVYRHHDANCARAPPGSDPRNST